MKFLKTHKRSQMRSAVKQEGTVPTLSTMSIPIKKKTV